MSQETASPAPKDQGTAHKEQPAATADRPPLLRQIAESTALMGILAVLSALIVGSLLILIADPQVRTTAGYFFARPSDFLSAAATSLNEAYAALLRGSILDWRAATLHRAVRPLTETLTIATPLILAGLGMAVSFRAGLFNIGGQGQLILGAILGSYVGIAWGLPPVVHILVAMAFAALGGLLWGGLAGVLRAKTGASEVIVTIMLNSVAGYLLAQVLTLDAFIGEGNSNPKSIYMQATAHYPRLLGESFRLHAGFVVALLAAAAVWWMMERSSLGFQFRATGLNANAARTAGMNVPLVTVLVMMVSGALCGLAATAPVLGTEQHLSLSVAGTIGFDAITVALLGRSTPLGTVLAGLLFGALRAGGTLMQAATGTPVDIVLVLQSTIVLFIAAPPLVRAIYRLPAQGSWRRQHKNRIPATAAQEA
ncbi:ABC transporter permease [Actinomyces bowdenii]|uniref:ABC transporter permease n=1 Tax=Actinomyces bowdenii TaxID=131109 RepID=UPI00214BA164|nr:ABC transporter permease [Actinomyces bowdenii]MCR2053342.1 ABC transporter permease [Actinomyces bowdenii]